MRFSHQSRGNKRLDYEPLKEDIFYSPKRSTGAGIFPSFKTNIIFPFESKKIAVNNAFQTHLFSLIELSISITAKLLMMFSVTAISFFFSDQNFQILSPTEESSAYS